MSDDPFSARPMIQRFENGNFKQNCYLVLKEGQALIIDPGSEPETISKLIEASLARPVAIINTHGHFDHIGAVEPLKRKFGIRFHLHSGDRKLIKRANLYMSLFLGKEPIEIPTIDEFLEQYEGSLTLGDFDLKLHHTPGHTPGGVCIQWNDCLFTGDTLLNGAIGRTDLPGGKESELVESLKFLETLDPELKVFPGHGKETTLKEQFELNSNLRRVLNLE